MRPIVRLCSALPFIVAACAPNGETAVNDSVATAASPVVDAAAVRQAIEQSNAKFTDALKRGDTLAMSGGYTDDAVMLMGGSPPARGAAEIDKAVIAMSKSMKFTDAKLTTSQVDVAGDFAIETGQFEMAGTPPGAKPVTVKGNYVTVWKKQTDGSWKIYRDVGVEEPPPKK